ncbi:MAG: hypothetical protein J6R35_01385, partial [Clostridia bacterium]|nr:hypothetical protein [Clostridia bacterium]
MAQPAHTGCLKGCIITPIITFIVLVLIIVIGVTVVLNMTPEKLGLADMELFEGETLRSLGLADVKIKEVFKLIKSIMDEPDESTIVTNKFDAQTEQTTTNSVVSGSNIVQADGSIDYSAMLENKVVYTEEKLLKYNDTTLAYIFNQMIADGSADSEEAIKFIKELNAVINEVSIIKSGDNTTLRIVASIATGSIAEEVNAALKETGVGFVGNMFKLPEKIYLVSYLNLNANEQGELVTSSQSIKINDADNAVSEAIFKVLSKKAQEVAEGEGQQVDTDRNAVNAKIGEAFVA